MANNLSALVSILIVTHNSKHLLAPLFDSIKRFASDAQIIIIDSASSDNSADKAECLCPAAKVIRKNENIGFVSGNNLAALYAQRNYLLLLNPDAFLQEFLDPAIEMLETTPEVGVVGAKMLGSKMEYRQSCGHFPFAFRLFFFSRIYTTKGHLRDGNFNSNDCPIPVDWVEGSFLLTRRDLWNNLGGMDNRYFMYVEEVDYCKRVNDLGFITLFHPKVSYQHLGGFNYKRIGYLIDGFRRFNYLHASFIGRVIATWVLDIGLILRAVYSFIRFIFGEKKQLIKAKVCIQALRNR